MAIATSNPTVVTSPNIGGSSAVSSPTVTGHSVTDTSTSAIDNGIGATQDNTQTKSARWSSFNLLPSGTVNSLHLKLNWVIEGSADASSSDVGADGEGSITFVIDYSINGGGAWSNALTKTKTATATSGVTDHEDINESGSIDITLLTSQNVSLVQVRCLTTSHAFASAVPGTSANATAEQSTTISDIKLEADITPTAGVSGNPNRGLSVIM